MPENPTMELASQYHDAMPERIRSYLHARGISDAAIDTHLLGWDGERITIPIFDQEGRIAFFKLAKDPEDPRAGPKMLTPAGQSPELYGWERLRVKSPRIVICEGEFDRLVLESQGLAAVTSTGGAGVFRAEWTEAFAEIPDVYVCLDRDEAGRRGAERVARLIPHAKIVELPEEVGPGGDVTDFFVRLGRTREDFLRLLEEAKPAPPEEPSPLRVRRRQASARTPSAEVARVKERVAIETLVGRYVHLHRTGPNYFGRCPFHDDEHPSLFVYPRTQRFHCYGCGEHGDVIAFLMRVEHLTFPEAVQALQHLAA